MDELLVYLYLSMGGFPLEDRYEKRLDELFSADPENELLLELELMTGNIRDSLTLIEKSFGIYEFELFDGREPPKLEFTDKSFCQRMMGVLKELYEPEQCDEFLDRLYMVWQWMPSILEDVGLFFTFRRAGDPLGWDRVEPGFKRVCAEDMLSFYEV